MMSGQEFVQAVNEIFKTEFRAKKHGAVILNKTLEYAAFTNKYIQITLYVDGEFIIKSNKDGGMFSDTEIFQGSLKDLDVKQFTKHLKTLNMEFILQGDALRNKNGKI
jgi:hypothetical protein